MIAAHTMHSSCRLLQRPLNPRQARVAAAACTSAAQASMSSALAKPRCSLVTRPFQLPFKHYSTPMGTSPARILEVTAASTEQLSTNLATVSGTRHRLIPYATVGTSGTSRAASAGGHDEGGGDPTDPFALAFWEQQVAQLPYRQAQALLRARGLRAAGRKEDVQLRLAEVLLEEHVEGNTPTDIDTPGVRELLISRAAEVQVGQGQGQTLLARGEDAQQGQGQGRGHGLLASGAAALKRQELEQRQGRQQPGDTAADRKSHRQSLRAQLARKLHPNYLEAFRDVDIDQLISIGCVNLHVLALLSAEDLSNAGLPIGPICVLQAAGLIGGAAGPGPSTGAAAGPGPRTAGSGTAEESDLAAYLKRWEAIEDPSALVPALEQGGGAHRRPAVHAGLHPALASPVFGRLIDRLAANARPSPEDLAVALELCKLASQDHTDQAHFAELLRDLLATYLDMPVLTAGPRPTSSMQADGMVLVNPHEDPLQWLLAGLLVVQVAGQGEAADSNFQGAAHYGIFWHSRRTSSFFRQTCCPALLLEVVGPHLRVSALYWPDKVTVRPLTSLIDLQWFDDNPDPDQMARLASTLAAVKAALQELQSSFSQQQQQQQLATQPPGRATGLLAAMPYPLAGYQQATLLEGGKLVYSARSSVDGKPAVVWFCSGYGEAAHRAWAAAGLAPQLHRVVRLPGGWLQVEMEWLGAADGWQELASIKEPAAAAAASAAALAALQQAHSVQGSEGERFAHGDMRVQNVMVRRRAGTSGGGSGGDGSSGGGGSGADGVGAYDVRFIDFEWSGVDGEATYPPHLNTAVGWPAGVEFGESVRQQQDTELLAMSVEQLLRYLRGPVWA